MAKAIKMPTPQFIVLAILASAFLHGCAVWDDSRRGEPDSGYAHLERQDSSVAAYPSDPAGTIGDEESAVRLRVLWTQRMTSSGDLDYELAPGDVLEITVPDMVDIKQLNIRVAGNNTIDFPLLGTIPVRGMTEQALRNELRRRLERYMYDPQVDLFVKEFRSHQVLVVGAVDKPGPYILANRRETILDMIARAGGLKEDAAERVLLVPGELDHRPNITSADDLPIRDISENQTGIASPSPELSAASGNPITLDLGNLTRGGDKGYLAIPARPGDVIIVPHAGEVLVEGWVGKPGSYKITSGLTVLGAVAAAGGPLFPAKQGDIRILRSRDYRGPRQVMHVDLAKIDRGEAPDIPVKEGDVVEADYSSAKILPYAFYSILSKFYLGASAPIF